MGGFCYRLLGTSPERLPRLTLMVNARPFGRRVDHELPDLFRERLEAPPGFEPGVEVLQAGPKNVKLLTRFAFWSALIPRFTPFLGGSVPTLVPSPLFP